jgi:predicted nucleotidyltransferase
MSKLKQPGTVVDVDRWIAQAVATWPAIQSAYLIGSHARGTARPDSDYDLLMVIAAIEHAEAAAGCRIELEIAARASESAGALDVWFLRPFGNIVNAPDTDRSREFSTQEVRDCRSHRAEEDTRAIE